MKHKLMRYMEWPEIEKILKEQFWGEDVSHISYNETLNKGIEEISMDSPFPLTNSTTWLVKYSWCDSTLLFLYNLIREQILFHLVLNNVGFKGVKSFPMKYEIGKIKLMVADRSSEESKAATGEVYFTTQYVAIVQVKFIYEDKT